MGGKQREYQRRQSMKTTNDNKKMYSKKKGNNKINVYTSTINEESEYQYEPSQAQYDENGIVEEEPSVSLEYSNSSNSSIKSAKSTKSKKKKKTKNKWKKASKPTPIHAVRSDSSMSDDCIKKQSKNKKISKEKE